jgi:superfamily II DNA or RNA helicase
MTYELRKYQQNVIDELHREMDAGHSRIVLGLATGAGKTVVAAHIAREAANNGKRVLFIVHLKTLVPQAVRHFADMGLRVGILRGEDTDYSAGDDIIVASIQTIRARSAPSWVELVIVDECHVLHQEHVRLMSEWRSTPFIGLTATPMRKDLGQHFTALIRGPSIKELTSEGSLVPAGGWAPGSDRAMEVLDSVAVTAGDFKESELRRVMSMKDIVGDPVETYLKRGEGRQAIFFAVDKAHSRETAERFNAHGTVAAHIEDKTPDDERREIFAAYRTGAIRILCSVGVLSVGFDMPQASCVILGRPTLSEMLHIQQIGRGLRPDIGKEDCLVLDHAGNTIRFGLPHHFEIPDLTAFDNETSRTKKKKRTLAACQVCGYILEAGEMTCPKCGTDRPSRFSGANILEGDLVAYGAMNDGRVEADPLHWYRGLRRIAEERGYSQGWTANKFREKFGRFQPWSWNRMESEEPGAEIRRWVKSRQIAWAKSRRAA